MSSLTMRQTKGGVIKSEGINPKLTETFGYSRPNKKKKKRIRWNEKQQQQLERIFIES